MVMMRNTSGNYNEGYARPDSKHKILTVILGFSREWPYERGCIRVLRSDSREDAAFEFPPEFGTCTNGNATQPATIIVKWTAKRTTLRGLGSKASRGINGIKTRVYRLLLIAPGPTVAGL